MLRGCHTAPSAVIQEVITLMSRWLALQLNKYGAKFLTIGWSGGTFHSLVLFEKTKAYVLMILICTKYIKCILKQKKGQRSVFVIQFFFSRFRNWTNVSNVRKSRRNSVLTAWFMLPYVKQIAKKIQTNLISLMKKLSSCWFKAIDLMC